MAKLPTGRYTVVDAGSSSSIVLGRRIDSMQVKADLDAGVYPSGMILMHVLSGQCFRVDINPVAIPFRDLTVRQKNRAERYRNVWWPWPEQRPRPRRRR